MGPPELEHETAGAAGTKSGPRPSLVERNGPPIRAGVVVVIHDPRLRWRIRRDGVVGLDLRHERTLSGRCGITYRLAGIAPVPDQPRHTTRAERCDARPALHRPKPRRLLFGLA